MKKIISVLALPVLLVAAYVGGNFFVASAIQKSLEVARTQPPEGLSLSFSAVESSYIMPRTILKEVVLREDKREFAIREVVLTGWWSGLPWLDRFTTLSLTGGEGREANALLRFDAAKISGIPLATLLKLADGHRLAYTEAEFANLAISGLTVSNSLPLFLLTAEKVETASLKQGLLNGLRIRNFEFNGRVEASPVASMKAATLSLSSFGLHQGDYLLDLTGLAGEALLIAGEPNAKAHTSIASGQVERFFMSKTHMGFSGKALAISLPSYPDRKPVNMTLDLGVSGPESKLDLSKLVLQSDDVGELTFNASVAGVPWPPRAMRSPMSWIGAAIVGFEGSFTDSGMVETQLKEAEKTSGLARDEVIESIRTDLDAAGLTTSKAGQQLTDTFIDFLKNPGKISFASRPATPVPLANIFMSQGGSAGLVEALQIFASNQPSPK